MSDSLITNEEFYDSMFHKGEYSKPVGWPSTTILLYRIRIKRGIEIVDLFPHLAGSSSLQCERWVKIDNLAGSHAEVVFIRQVNDLLDRLRKDQQFSLTIKQFKIDIVLNYSPCSSCAEKLIELKTTIEDEKSFCVMNIKFSNFYKHYHSNNMRKLIEMVQKQVQISVFDGFCDWKDFLDNTVKLPLNMQSENFMETWHVRKERESIDSILLECIRQAALKWGSLEDKQKKNIVQAMVKIKIDSSELAFECLNLIRQ